MACAGCEKRRAWINKMKGLAGERARTIFNKTDRSQGSADSRTVGDDKQAGDNPHRRGRRAGRK